ncbi:MAG: transglutaminase domain-containing protein [Chloroflexota bacterium]
MPKTGTPKTTNVGETRRRKAQSTKYSVDTKLVKRIKEEYAKEVEVWPEVHAEPITPRPTPTPKGPEDELRRRLPTMYEGEVLYLKYWNFWKRPGFNNHASTDRFFHDYEADNRETRNLVSAVIGRWPPGLADTEREVWDRIGRVWSWLRDNVSYDTDYSDITSADRWPSIAEYARYYASHGRLVWVACFSKAHLFANLLGRCAVERWRCGIASAHHTEGGAPPTASHVFVGVYIAGRWYYLDPTWVQAVPELPGFDDRDSVGLFELVDYSHPFSFIPLPLSPFVYVPLLSDE